MLAVAVSGCVGVEDAWVAESTRVWDSAGVRIVDNGLPLWAPGAEWTLGVEPRLVIGVLEGRDEYQMYQVGGVLVLEDGRVAVANGGSSQVRYYDAGGRFLTATGKDGEGPGEFRSLGKLMRFRGDSLMAFDFRLLRATVLDPSGNVGRSFLLGGGDVFSPTLRVVRTGPDWVRTSGASIPTGSSSRASTVIPCTWPPTVPRAPT